MSNNKMQIQITIVTTYTTLVNYAWSCCRFLL